MAKTKRFILVLVLVVSTMGENQQAAAARNYGNQNRPKVWPQNGVLMGKRASEPGNDLPSEDKHSEEPMILPDVYRWQWLEDSKELGRFIAKMLAIMGQSSETGDEQKGGLTDAKNLEQKGYTWPPNGILIGKRTSGTGKFGEAMKLSADYRQKACAFAKRAWEDMHSYHCRGTDYANI